MQGRDVQPFCLQMTLTKRLRLVFYFLVTLEVVLASGYYTWSHLALR